MVTAQNLKTYIINYWISWMIVVIFILIIPIIFPRLSEDEIDNVFWFIMIPYYLSVGIIGIFEGFRISSYLESHHKDYWKEKTKLFFCLGPGINGFQTIAFIFSDDLSEDLIVEMLKVNYKNYLKFILVVFISIPILGFINSI